MAYRNNKTYLTKREREIRKHLRDRNIEGLLWVILDDCFEDMESNNSARYGKSMLSFVIQQLAVMESKRGKKGSGLANEETMSVIDKWLSASGIAKDEPQEEPEEEGEEDA